MQRIINRISQVSIASLALLMVGIAPGFFRPDPTDDFGFELSRDTSRMAFHLMPANRIEHVLRDHLKTTPRAQVRRLARHLHRLCVQYRFDPAFILSLVEVESNFRSHVVSSAGAVGLMQIQPATAAIVARRYGLRYENEHSLFNPFVNLSIGVAYLSFLRAKYPSVSPYFSLAAYNVGPARLDELLARKTFRPSRTLQYYDAVLQGMHNLRFYKGYSGPQVQVPVALADRS